MRRIGRGRLAGTTHPGGEKYIHIDYALQPDDPRRVRLKVTPEIHAESVEKHWVQRDGTYQEMPHYLGRMFSELAATVWLSDGQFLVIGPSEQADIEYLLGSRFLQRNDGDRRCEVLLFATPQLFRTDVAER